jgi:hypothetical protein
MDDEQVRKLMADEIAVLREIARWRRNHDIHYWRARGILGRFVQWSEIGRDGRQVSIDLYRGDDGPYVEMTIGNKREFGGLKVGERQTVTQAIDVLAALGYLPPRFSSAYRSGWDARSAWDGAPIRLTGDDGQLLVPAVESAW